MNWKRKVLASLFVWFLLTASCAWTWDLAPRAKAEYEKLRLPDKVRMEGWFSGLPDSEETESFRELARGTLLWSTKKPRGGLADLIALFSHADQKKSVDPVDVVLKTDKGKIILGIRLETDLCT
jgi:hypothetical protein